MVVEESLDRRLVLAAVKAFVCFRRQSAEQGEYLRVDPCGRTPVEFGIEQALAVRDAVLRLVDCLELQVELRPVDFGVLACVCHKVSPVKTNLGPVT